MSASLPPRHAIEFRSMLFVPGDRPDRVARAAQYGPDAVVVDFEDAVRPEQKLAARRGAADVLRKGYSVPLYIRVNAPGSDWYWDDVQLAVDVCAAGIMVPKAEDATALAELSDHLDRMDTRLAQAGSLEIVPLIETARGVARILDILAASARIHRCMFGAYDYVRDMQLERTAEGMELIYPRSALAVAGRASNCQTIDSPFAIVNDQSSLKLDCLAGKRTGLTGKGAIHPNQIPTIHEVFTPSESQIAAARRMVEAFDASGTGAVLVDGEMLDKATVDHYRNLLTRQR